MTVGFGSDGLPVVAAENGVLRFDGSSWANLGLPWDFDVSVQPFSVAVAPDGSVLTSGRGGMARHDGNEWALVEGPAGLEVEAVAALRSEPDGTVAAGFLHPHDGEQAVSVGFGSGGDWTILGPEEGLPQGLVTSLAWDSSGALWVGLWGYIARCDDLSCADLTTVELLTGGEIHAVASDPDGHIWVASEKDLWEVDGDEVTVHVEDRTPLAPAFTPDGEAVDRLEFPDFALAVAPDGTIWLGTAHFDGELWTVYGTDDGLADGYVDGVWVSPDGSVWFTIFHDGLSRHIPGGAPVVGSPTVGSGMVWADAPVTTFEVPPEPPVWPTTTVLGGYSDAEITYFRKIVGGAEYSPDLAVIHRWDEDVRITIRGDATEADRAVLQAVIDELNLLVEDIEIGVVPTGGNVELHFAPQETFADLEPNYVPGNAGFWWVTWNAASAIEFARVLVASDNITPNERAHLIREGITDCLGFLNDSWEYPESIFYQGWTARLEFAVIDRAVVEMMYREEVRPNMSIDAAVAVLQDLNRLQPAA